MAALAIQRTDNFLHTFLQVCGAASLRSLLFSKFCTLTSPFEKRLSFSSKVFKEFAEIIFILFMIIIAFNVFCLFVLFLLVTVISAPS